MNSKIKNRVINICKLIYFLFCLFIINSFSFFEEEIYIDGNDIKNACIAHRALAADDIRDFTAPTAVIFIIPFLVLAFKSKGKSLLTNLILLTLIAYWIWRFFIRLMIC
ncbi:MAG: YjeO family protein [Enterobacteriaceae bacterium]|jgi:hypothetical protein|nr:YjeO family protein [Enterobacteriaceae bacterium]